MAVKEPNYKPKIKRKILRYFLHLSYKGTNYSGWQRQNNAVSIQGTIEDCLSKMLRSKMSLVGCGRTDAGVHASQYFAQFSYEKEFDFDPVFRLNKMLPNDIAIHDCLPVQWDQHVQFNAKWRTYTYHIHGQKNPFLSEGSAYYPLDHLDFNLLEQCAQLIEKAEDFLTFCKQPAVYKHTKCTIKSARFQRAPCGTKIVFEITANRFLRGMIRLLVGNMLEVANGRTSLIDFEKYLSNESKPSFFQLAYPQGLYLSKVVYDFDPFGIQVPK